jgi:hypothetical protein
MKRIILLAALIAAFGLSSCRNPSSPDVSSETKGSLTISATLPSAAKSLHAAKGGKGLTVSTVAVTLTPASGSAVTLNLSYDSSTSTASGTASGLATGSWTVVGNAYDSGNDLLYSGQTTVAIATGTNSISLDLIQESGALTVSLSWPYSYPFTSATVTASRSTFSDVSTTVSISGTTSSDTVYLTNLTSGDWTLTANLYLNSVKYFTYTGTATVSTGVFASISGTMAAVKAAPVVADPAAGAYNLNDSGYYDVDLSCGTAGADIYYTTNGTTPSKSAGTLYSSASPVAIAADTTLKAISYATGLTDGDAQTFSFLARTAAPTPSVAAGTSTSPVSVKLSSVSSGVTIRFTLDGSTPTTTSGGVYSDGIPILLTQSSTTLKAISYKGGCEPSEVFSGVYAVSNPASVDLVPVAGGSFSNGTATMTVSPFYMAKYPITQKQYEAALSTTSLPATSYGLGDSYPVYGLSWYDAVELCNALSAKDGLDAVYAINKTAGSDPNNISVIDPYQYLVTADYSKNGYRLPTESEWEYACRAGTTTNYYWGDTFDSSYAWYSGNSSSSTQPVGTKPPNAWGLYDMSGNVNEWCWDWYGNYSSSGSTNSIGASSGQDRVLRGGSYLDDDSGCTSSYRNSSDPSNTSLYWTTSAIILGKTIITYHYDYYGLRVVRGLSN